MKRLLTATAALFALALPQLASAAAWEIDASHSAAQFSVRHLMVSNVRGSLGAVKGTVNWDGKDASKASVEATIDVSGINTGDGKRDGHLKSPDFFDVAKYPTITFKSTKVAAAGAGKLKVTGDLTLHGVTKQVVLDVEGPAAEVKDPWGNIKSGAVATTKLNRKDFGLGWNKVLETGGVAVGEEVAVIIDLELQQKADAKKPEPKKAK